MFLEACRFAIRFARYTFVCPKCKFQWFSTDINDNKCEKCRATATGHPA